MKLLFRRHRKISRGQAMVEFALILPLLALLLLLAIDFGRVFFGWVALNNGTRIAANEAALNPDAWVAPVNATDQARYRQQILNDMQAINCAPLGGGTWDVSDIPDPVFEDKGGTADPHEIGDHATVALECGFTFLTPLIGNIMGNPMTISARSEFAVRGGVIAGVPIATAIPSGPPASSAPALCPLPVPQLIGLRVNAGEIAWTVAGYTGAFNVSRANPEENGNYIITAVDLVQGEFYPCDTPVTVGHP
jgi:Flp pilus assembly pilin Flp